MNLKKIIMKLDFSNKKEEAYGKQTVTEPVRTA